MTPMSHTSLSLIVMNAFPINGKNWFIITVFLLFFFFLPPFFSPPPISHTSLILDDPMVCDFFAIIYYCLNYQFICSFSIFLFFCTQIFLFIHSIASFYNFKIFNNLTSTINVPFFFLSIFFII